MTKKPFTSGPWQTNPETPYLAAQVRDDVGRILADVYGESRETRKANARLMAAAPDGYALAEHIEAMANEAYLVGHPEWEAIVSEAKAFLGKARGEQ